MSKILLIIILALFICGVIFFAILLLKEIRQVVSGYGVPFVPTPDHKVKGLIGKIEFKDGQTFADIGCGDGKILQAMNERFPHSRIIGYESSGYPYRLAVKRKSEFACGYTVLNEDFFYSKIGDVDVFYTYMLPYLMPKIWTKIKKECKSGTLLYSSAFPVPNEPIYKTIELGGKEKIFVYRI